MSPVMEGKRHDYEVVSEVRLARSPEIGSQHGDYGPQGREVAAFHFGSLRLTTRGEMVLLRDLAASHRFGVPRPIPTSMPDITQDFPIAAAPDRVFSTISTAAGLDHWWTKRASGQAQLGSLFDLGFGPGYEWQARVTRYVPEQAFELELISADADWLGTRVGFELSPSGAGTQVRFHHTSWPEANQHYRTSCYCWAMYLRIMKRYLEYGETVPYEQRLEV